MFILKFFLFTLIITAHFLKNFSFYINVLVTASNSPTRTVTVTLLMNTVHIGVHNAFHDTRSINIYKTHVAWA